MSLLPALPQSRPEGSVSGLRGRGGFEIDLEWRANRLKEARLLSVNGNKCKLLVKDDVKVFYKGKEVQAKKNADNTLEFNTQKGGVYKITGQ